MSQHQHKNKYDFKLLINKQLNTNNECYQTISSYLQNPDQELSWLVMTYPPLLLAGATYKKYDKQLKKISAIIDIAY